MCPCVQEEGFGEGELRRMVNDGESEQQRNEKDREREKERERESGGAFIWHHHLPSRPSLRWGVGSRQVFDDEHSSHVWLRGPSPSSRFPPTHWLCSLQRSTLLIITFTVNAALLRQLTASSGPYFLLGGRGLGWMGRPAGCGGGKIGREWVGLLRWRAGWQCCCRLGEWKAWGLASCGPGGRGGQASGLMDAPSWEVGGWSA